MTTDSMEIRTEADGILRSGLVSILGRHGEVHITRDELRRRLWPDNTFVDFEHGLNAAVKRLRDTLGDSADSPRFIETVPRRVYRFIAPASVPGEPASRTTQASGLWSVRRAWVIVAVGVDAICEALSCQPGDILRFEPEPAERKRPAAANKRSAGRWPC